VHFKHVDQVLNDLGFVQVSEELGEAHQKLVIVDLVEDYLRLQGVIGDLMVLLEELVEQVEDSMLGLEVLAVGIDLLKVILLG
jgi:hypothetical protein